MYKHLQPGLVANTQYYFGFRVTETGSKTVQLISEADLAEILIERYHTEANVSDCFDEMHTGYEVYTPHAVYRLGPFQR